VSQMLIQQELRRRVGAALVPPSPEDAARASCPSAPHSSIRQPSLEEAATTLAEPEEVLVADPRGGLAPAQMVDQKLLALLRTGNPGLFLQAAGGLQDIRRLPRGRKAPTPVSREPDATPP
jgi:hypothetical protein